MASARGDHDVMQIIALAGSALAPGTSPPWTAIAALTVSVAHAGAQLCAWWFRRARADLSARYVYTAYTTGWAGERTTLLQIVVANHGRHRAEDLQVELVTVDEDGKVAPITELNAFWFPGLGSDQPRSISHPVLHPGQEAHFDLTGGINNTPPSVVRLRWRDGRRPQQDAVWHVTMEVASLP